MNSWSDGDEIWAALVSVRMCWRLFNDCSCSKTGLKSDHVWIQSDCNDPWWVWRVAGVSHDSTQFSFYTKYLLKISASHIQVYKSINGSKTQQNKKVHWTQLQPSFIYQSTWSNNPVHYSRRRYTDPSRLVDTSVQLKPNHSPPICNQRLILYQKLVNLWSKKTPGLKDKFTQKCQTPPCW